MAEPLGRYRVIYGVYTDAGALVDDYPYELYREDDRREAVFLYMDVAQRILVFHNPDDIPVGMRVGVALMNNLNAVELSMILSAGQLRDLSDEFAAMERVLVEWSTVCDVEDVIPSENAISETVVQADNGRRAEISFVVDPCEPPAQAWLTNGDSQEGVRVEGSSTKVIPVIDKWLKSE